METARASALRHPFEGRGNCLRGEAAGALLATVDRRIARLLGGRGVVRPAPPSMRVR